MRVAPFNHQIVRILRAVFAITVLVGLIATAVVADEPSQQNGDSATEAADSSDKPEPADRDGDGIWDASEAILGTNPDRAESLQPVIDEGVESEDRRARPEYDPTKDVMKISCGHAGEDRFVWRATFAEPPRPEDTVFHLYVDADLSDETGRVESPGSTVDGTDYMLTVSNGRGHSTQFQPDGQSGSGPTVSYVVQGNALLLTADVDLARDDRGARYQLYVLCHSSVSAGDAPRMSDSSPKVVVEGIATTDAKKIRRVCDFNANYRVSATFGHNLLLKTLADEGNHVVWPRDMQMEGFAVDLENHGVWPRLARTADDGCVWTTPPKAGKYYVGFMIYDDGADRRVGIYINDKLMGVGVANASNYQQWLLWLSEPYDFSGNERVELRPQRLGSRSEVANILFMTEPPEARRIEYKVQDMVAVTPVDRPGEVILSWTTTWPCRTRLQYGPATDYGQVVEDDHRCLAHRVLLTGLDPATTYHARAIGRRPDGSEFVGEDFTFRPQAEAPPPTVEQLVQIPLTIENPPPTALSAWPITTGIPVPQGQLASSDEVRLMHDGGEVPVQVSVAARWPDGSVKWLLLSFVAELPADAAGEYVVEYQRGIKRADVANPVAVSKSDDGGATVNTGQLELGIDRLGRIAEIRRNGQSMLHKDRVCQTMVTDAEGIVYSSAREPVQITIEEAGPVRVVVKIVSRPAQADKESPLAIEKRIFAYRGMPMVEVEHTLVVCGEPDYSRLERVAWQLPLAGADSGWQIPLEDGPPITLDSTTPAVWQRTEQHWIARKPGDAPAPEGSSAANESVEGTLRDAEPVEGRIAGRAVAEAEPGCGVVLRNFWQNYPKGLSIADGALQIELCPDFEAGYYDQFPFEKEGHHLFFYLRDGQYQLRRGMAKTHRLMLCFDAKQLPGLAAAFERRPLATASPEWYCGSRAIRDIAPRDTERFALYEAGIDKNIDNYAAARTRQRDFGMMNFGDWYGERGANWGNIEYDTQFALLLEYVRSGNASAFFLGEEAELHNRDVDTIHYSPNANDLGAVYVHQMGHVGGYYDQGVPDTLGIPKAGYTVSHAWTEGHFLHYFLTGDRRSLETGRQIADFFMRKDLGRPYHFTSTRVPGWHLIMSTASYLATGDPYYLNGSHVIVRNVLQRQDNIPRAVPEYQRPGRQPYQLGGWARMLAPGHCRCEPRHQGNAGFMIAILLSGMKYYHDITGDPEVKDSIVRGAHYLLEETYSPEKHGFRYTSCPATSYGRWALPLMVEGVARAYVWTKDERFRSVLVESLPRGTHGSTYGKGFSMFYRCGPQVLHDLKAAGLTLNTKPEEEAESTK